MLVRTLPSQGGKSGSLPLRAANGRYNAVAIQSSLNYDNSVALNHLWFFSIFSSCLDTRLQIKRWQQKKTFLRRGSKNFRLRFNKIRLRIVTFRLRFNETRLRTINSRPGFNETRPGIINFRLNFNETRQGIINSRPNFNETRPSLVNFRPWICKSQSKKSDFQSWFNKVR